MPLLTTGTEPFVLFFSNFYSLVNLQPGPVHVIFIRLLLYPPNDVLPPTYSCIMSFSRQLSFLIKCPQ